jgi:TRAP-type C4-dicarboxylate transport system permease small subunit
MLLCGVLLTIGAGRQALINLGSRSAVMEASLAWLDAAVLVFGLCTCLILLAGIRKRGER